MKAPKITNVTLVVNHFLKYTNWKHITILFTVSVHSNHKCESCGKSFSRVDNLKTHIHTVHESHKDHKCESCDKSFTEVGSLKKHIYIIHKGHKDYKCKSCGRSFSRADHLKKHLQRYYLKLEMWKCCKSWLQMWIRIRK